jgi:transposase
MKITTIGLDLAKTVFHVVGQGLPAAANDPWVYGAIVSGAFITVEGDGNAFRRGRDVSAVLGLAPAQHSSGGKDRLLGISKRGDRHVRSLWVQGARSVVLRAAGEKDRLSRWINRIRQDRGTNKAVVALANKMARIGWAILRHGTEYHPA